MKTIHKVVRFLFSVTPVLLLIHQSGLYAQEAESIRFELPEATLTGLQWSPANPDPETIIALPWRGGAATGYRYVGPLLANAGYRLIAINPRGIQGSTGDLEKLTLHVYAEDVSQAIETLGLDKVHMMGWAWGNRVARTVASDYPQLVTSVTLLAAGGMVRPLVSLNGIGRVRNESNLSLVEQIRLIREPLFADRTSDSLINEFIANMGDWDAGNAAQGEANRATDVAEWWGGGSAPMLIVQGKEDKTAPPENGELMKEEFGDRITVVDLDDAGHMMGLERPGETAAAVISFLNKHSQ